MTQPSEGSLQFEREMLGVAAASASGAQAPAEADAMGPPAAAFHRAAPRVVEDTPLRIGQWFASAAPLLPERAEPMAAGSQGETPDPLEIGGVGLALSGGGIRSATFGLGVIQALAQRACLSKIDYLSTVSGGGYIGGWLTGCVRNFGGVDAVESRLRGTASLPPHLTEPSEVTWLRRYSHYLAPRFGFFSADLVALALGWLRNALLNLVVMLSLLTVLLVVPLGLAQGLPWLLAVDALELGLLPGFAFGISFIYLAIAMSAQDADKRGALMRWVLRWLGAWHSRLRALLPSVDGPALQAGARSAMKTLADAATLSAAVGVILLGVIVGGLDDLTQAALPLAGFLGVYLLLACMVAIGMDWRYGESRHLTFGKRVWALLVSAVVYVVAAAVGVTLMAGLVLAGHAWLASAPSVTQRHIQALTFGPVMVMLAFMASTFVFVGLVGAQYRERTREFWSRAITLTGKGCAIWVVWMLLAFYVPGWLDKVVPWLDVRVDRAALAATAGSAFIAWLTAAVPAKGPSRLGQFLAATSSAFAVLAAVGLLMLGAWVVNAIVATSPLSLPMLAGACLIGLWLFGHQIDINLFSMQALYRVRLVRCYLGASNPRRDATGFTGIDEGDDMPLAPEQTMQEAPHHYRPLHLVNTAMNLTVGQDLGLLSQKSANYVLSPMYCGFQTTARATSEPQQLAQQGARLHYVPTRELCENDPSLTLGAAMATSGAAVSPNMGRFSSGALAFVLTVLNLRLGRWAPNPKTPERRGSPHFGPDYLLKELRGQANDQQPFVYLSDGGHFENLGLYELVRRRCRLIVCVDAAADPQYSHDDLGNAIRQVRLDFGAEVEIDLSPLQPDGEGFSARAFAVGTIRYPDLPADQRSTLIYLKPCMVAGLSADLITFRNTYSQFPQQGTGNQFFNEAQFESYRALGQQLMRGCLDTAAASLPVAVSPTGQAR